MPNQTKKTFRISGQVIDRTTAQGVGELRVEAWDKDQIVDDLVGSTITDAKGRFSITFDPSYFAELFLDRQPDLYFKVFSGDELIASSEDSVLWNVRAEETEIVIEVDRPVVAKPVDPPPVVQGRVTLSDGSSYVGGMVRAFDQDLRNRQPLGGAKIDGKGAYKIEYTPAQYARAEKGSADLVVEVYRQGKVGEELLVASSVWFKAPPVVTVNLTVPNEKIRVPSELELYLTSIAPLLEGAGVLLSDLNDEDIAFITGETGIASQHVNFLVRAARLELKTRVDQRVFYACSRNGLPFNLQALLDVPAAQRAAAVDAAIAGNLVPSFAADEQKTALAVLESLSAERQSEQTLDKPLPVQQIKVRQILDMAGLSDVPQRETLARILAEIPSYGRLWERIESLSELPPKAVQELKLTVGIADLMGYKANCLGQLRQLSKTPIDKLSDLVALEESDWLRIGKAVGFPPDVAGADDAEKARALVQRIHGSMPDERLGYLIESGQAPGISDQGKREQLAHIAKESPFDVVRADLSKTLSAMEQAAVGPELSALQRLARLTTDGQEIDALMLNGIDSASVAVATGRSTVIQDLLDRGVTSERARSIFDNAEAVAGASLVIGHVMDGRSDATPTPGSDLGPTWRNLFGDHELDPCDEVHSALGTAAYLADLLAYLKHSDTNAGSKNAFDALIARRPDLAQLEFTQANAGVELPEIDLVNELLANELAGPSPSMQTPDVTAVDELLVTPCPGNLRADTLLAAATPPWVENSRKVELYLGLLGVDLDELRHLHREANQPLYPDPAEIANELGVSTEFLDSDVNVGFQTGKEPLSDLAAKLGATVDNLENWAADPPDASYVDSLLEAIKTRWSGDAWKAKIKPVHDTLREERRDALCIALQQRDATLDMAALSLRLLADVAVAAGRRTTRLAHATIAVLQFVDRIALHQESDQNVILSPSGITRWKWLGSYENWRLHRQIFLHPASLLRPELRDDKTPLFQELEQELLQGKVTPQRVEQALRSYLVKLSAIANLQVCALCTSIDDSRETLHVFARTRDTPHTYYHRSRIDGAHWTAWEKLNLDIDGDQLIPVVFEGRLYLFWPVYEERIDPQFKKLEQLIVESLRAMVTMMTALAAGTYDVARIVLERIKEFLQDLLNGLKDLDPTKFKVALDSHDWPQAPSFPSPLDARNAIENNLGQVKSNIQNPLFSTVHGHVQIKEDPIVQLNQWMTSVGDSLQKGDIQKVIVDLRSAGEFIFQKMQEVLPTKKICVQLAWAERHDETWSQRKLSNEEIQYSDLSAVIPGHRRRTYDFFAGVKNNVLRIECHLAVGAELDNSLVGTFSLASASAALEATTKMPEITITPEQFLADLEFAAKSSTRRFTDGQPISEADEPLSILRRNLDQDLRPADDFTPRRLVAPLRSGPTFFDDALVFLMEDVGRTFFGQRSWPTYSRKTIITTTFRTFYHPFAANLLTTLDRGGIPAMFDLEQVQEQRFAWFSARYPSARGIFVSHDDPVEDIDFSFGGAYAAYNWEIFVHIPLLIAAEYTRNQCFDEAQLWLRLVFNPTVRLGNAPERYWRTSALRSTSDASLHQQILRELDPSLDPAATSGLLPQVQAWQNDPFNPWAIARLRPSAIQQYVVMAHLDNLIERADYEEKQAKRRSVYDATKHYNEALLILGAQPGEFLPGGERPVFAQLATRSLVSSRMQAVEQQLHIGVAARTNSYLLPTRLQRNFGNVRSPTSLMIERPIATFGPVRSADWLNIAISPSLPLTSGVVNFFQTPPDESLIERWVRIEEALRRLRSLDRIYGATGLPLHGVGTMTRADRNSNDTSVAVGQIYRFSVVVQKARELADWLAGLGGAQLAALEKRDGEELARLRSTQEISLLQATQQIKQWQIEEAMASRRGLERAKANTEIRIAYYTKNVLLPTNPLEVLSLGLNGASLAISLSSALSYLVAGPLGAIPEAKLGFVTTLGASYGGDKAASIPEQLGNALGRSTGLLDKAASMVGTMGGYLRRWEEWVLQLAQAKGELTQLDKQIEAATRREDIARRDLENHQLQIDHAQAVGQFLRLKFSNRELYKWMADELGKRCSETFTMALELARAAEWCYNFEIGTKSALFDQVAWDTGHRGMLSGEALSFLLRKLEADYLKENRRDFEISRPVSLVLHDPLALIELKTTGRCTVHLPEALFDSDYPGHYMRRIRNVGITIPCVIGPFGSINCTLRLLGSWVRENEIVIPGSQYGDPQNLTARVDVPSTAIATSTAQSDSGLFELNFRDDRYLPFEGAGAISVWQIDMPIDTNSLDFDTISDVIFRINYTAREASTNDLRDSARTALGLAPAVGAGPVTSSQIPARETSARMFSLRHEFATEWNTFSHGTPPRSITVNLDQRHFPFTMRGRPFTIYRIDLFVGQTVDGKVTLLAPQTLGIEVGLPDLTPVAPDPRDLAPNIPYGVVDGLSVAFAGSTRIEVNAGVSGTIDEIILVCHYQ